jgi:hypothetical protein
MQKRRILSLLIPVFLFALALPQSQAGAQEISVVKALGKAGRLTNWKYAGVPGGIPDRTKICASFTPVTGTADAINSAIASCNHGVVWLGPGTYDLWAVNQGQKVDTPILMLNSHVTLRGAGADKTILRCGECFVIGKYLPPNLDSSLQYPITAGAKKDSFSIAVSTTAGLSVGSMIEIDRDNDTSIPVYFQPGGADCGTTTSPGPDYYACGTRMIRQDDVITAINGNTLSLRNPLLWDFSTGNPKLKGTFRTPIIRSGVEDLKLDHSEPLDVYGHFSAQIQFCDSCWVKGVESYDAYGYHLVAIGTVNLEIRDSYFHESQTGGSDNGGIDIYGTPGFRLYTSTDLGVNSDWKVENNILWKLFPGIQAENSSSGGVVGYNYSYGSAGTGLTNANGSDSYIVTWTFDDNHGDANLLNLYEGNVGEMYGADGYWGGSGYGLAFRNFFLGLNRNGAPNYGNNVGDTIRLLRGAYDYSFVGNVLGNSIVTPLGYEGCQDFYDSDSPGFYSIYQIGNPNIGNCSLSPYDGSYPPGVSSYPDPNVGGTLLRWGNYDYFNKDVEWNASEIPSNVTVPNRHTLPGSFYYSHRPDWFPKDEAWPPIGPDVFGGQASFGDDSGHVNDIPSQLCWAKRKLLIGGSFNAADCYSRTRGENGRD